jgi:hypothetical protein
MFSWGIYILPLTLTLSITLVLTPPLTLSLNLALTLTVGNKDINIGSGFVMSSSGIYINNYRTTLPMGKGLSSSAAVCVLVTKCFNEAYGLELTLKEIMETAYKVRFRSRIALIHPNTNIT